MIRPVLAAFVACAAFIQPPDSTAAESQVIAQTKSPIDQKGFDKELRDVRRDIINSSPTVQRSGESTKEIIVDVCKTNPALPQCKFK
jgi:hypothetical protein